MSLTKNKMFLVKFTAYFLIFLFCYFFLVVGDYFIAKFLKDQIENNIYLPRFTINAEKIIKDRKIKEDFPQRKQAISEGFKPIFYPTFLDRHDHPLKPLAIKYGVAPLSPQPKTKLYYCNEGYGLVKYKSDKFGFRNHDNDWDKKVDIVLIGDSFTHGGCLPQEDTIDGNLSIKYNTLNLATGGNNPVHYASLVKKFVPLIQPKYVSIIFFANDYKDGNKESYFYEYYFEKNNSYFKDEENKLLDKNLYKFYEEATLFLEKKVQKEIQQKDANFFERGPLFERASKYFFLPNIRRITKKNNSNLNFQENKTSETSQIDFGSKLAIDTLYEICEEFSCIPLIIYIPNNDLWRTYPLANDYEGKLSQYSHDLNLLFWNSSKKIKSNRKLYYAKKGGHLSPNGNTVIADGIKKLINSSR